MSKLEILNKRIHKLENRIEHLEATVEILNTVIETADKMLCTNIRKKVFASVFRHFRQRTGSSRKYYSVKNVSEALGYSRKYYFELCRAEQKKSIIENQVLSIVQSERKSLRQLGGKKLYHKIKLLLDEHGIKFGRDKLFVLLEKNHLLITRKKRYIKTTISIHSHRKHPNLVKATKIIMPEQVWVSDITYLRTKHGFCYLNMVTDAYSRKIMGYTVAATMNRKAMIAAYRMALSNRVYPATPLIHHSDRGGQYCSKDYIELSKNHHVKISMTENGDPYENALAERMNRTMKEEFGLGVILPSLQTAQILVAESVLLYNSERPHWSLKLKTPDQAHSLLILSSKTNGN